MKGAYLYQFITSVTTKKTIKQAIKLGLQNSDKLCLTSALAENNVAKLSVVGCGLCSDVCVASRMLKALKDKGIQIKSMVAAEIKISVLIPEAAAQEAISAVHTEFFK